MTSLDNGDSVDMAKVTPISLATPRYFVWGMRSRPPLPLLIYDWDFHGGK